MGLKHKVQASSSNGGTGNSSSFSMEKVESELAALTSDSERIEELKKRLAESEKEKDSFREKAAVTDKCKKALDLMEKKNERANALLLKTEESKGRLEELCRELQRVNKEIREESIARMKALEAERSNSVEKLRLSLKDIEQTMQEGHGKSDELAAENARLAGKMNELASEYKGKIEAYSQQCEKKEKYWQELVNAHQAESNLLKAKINTCELRMKKAELEKAEMERSLLEGTARVGGAIESERQLREQVKEYSDKYASLHKSLASSNEAFDKFKKEIDRVTSKLSKVEVESAKWKSKFDEASKNILVLTVAKTELEETVAGQVKKVKMLEGLCRELTARKEGEDKKAEGMGDNEEKKE